MSKRYESNAARKGPKQQRSKVTVAAILEATIRILEQEGSDATTTSRIAEVAGVSVGTLPNPVLALELESKALWQYVGVDGA